MKRLAILFAAAVAATGVLLSPTGASASSKAPTAADLPAPAAQVDTANRIVVASDTSPAATSLQSCLVAGFDYTGYARCGSYALTCDWNIDGYDDELFVVADNRTIWHAWPNSGGFLQMPNGGKADDMNTCYLSSNGNHVVEVWVGGSIWWSYRDSGGKWWGWYAK